jgi:hypothetical protein
MSYPCLTAPSRSSSKGELAASCCTSSASVGRQPCRRDEHECQRIRYPRVLITLPARSLSVGEARARQTPGSLPLQMTRASARPHAVSRIIVRSCRFARFSVQGVATCICGEGAYKARAQSCSFACLQLDFTHLNGRKQARLICSNSKTPGGSLARLCPDIAIRPRRAT